MGTEIIGNNGLEETTSAASSPIQDLPLPSRNNVVHFLGETKLLHEKITPDRVVCRRSADIIAGDVTPGMIAKVINTANQEGFAIHGVSNYSALSGVFEDGVAPLTPEGGFGAQSFWTSGIRMFSNSNNADADGGMITYDTTFFHYAHTSAQSPKNKAIMTMAITKLDDLSGEMSGRSRGYITYAGAVPRDNMHLVQVVIDTGKLPSNRKTAQFAEQEMLKAMLGIMKGQYQAGGETIIKKNIH